MLEKLLHLIFPPKCLFCQKVLLNDEADMCRTCRNDLDDFPRTKNKYSFVAGWTALWYYNGDHRNSVLRYKFRDLRNYAPRYGKLLSMGILQSTLPKCDFITWVPVSAMRKFSRGFDQVELIARATGKEMKMPVVSTLKKIRNTPPQSGIRDASARRANVLGAYKVKPRADVEGKRILLLDDVITTGSTISECAKMLLLAGAKEVYCAALAASSAEKTRT